MASATRARTWPQRFKELTPKRFELVTEDLTFWPDVRRVEPELLAKCKRFFLLQYVRCTVFLWTEDGRVYSFGDNSFGMLGLGHLEEEVWTPQEVVELRRLPVVQMACPLYGNTIMALTDDGRLFGWGRNRSGQVGVGIRRKSVRRGPGCVLTPTLVMSNVQRVQCGSYHTAALDTNGYVWCWGSTRYCATGAKNGRNAVPFKVLHPKRVIDLCCNSSITLVLTAEYEMYHWGEFERIIISLPTLIQMPFPRSVRVVALGALDNMYLMVNNLGELYCCSYKRKFRHILKPPVKTTLADAEFDYHKIPLPEPINGQRGVLSPNLRMSVMAGQSGRILCVIISSVSNRFKVSTNLCNTVVDMCALFKPYPSTPDITEITERAIQRLGPFNDPNTSDYRFNDMYLTRASLQEKQLESYFIDQRRSYDYSMRTFFIYLYYRYNGTLLTEHENTVLSVFGLAYQLEDTKLMLFLAGQITTILCHHYLRHRYHLRQWFEYQIIDLTDQLYTFSSPRVAQLFKQSNVITHLDCSLKGRIIRWIIQRASDLTPCIRKLPIDQQHLVCGLIFTNRTE